MIHASRAAIAAVLLLGLQGCMMNSQDQVLATDGTQLQLRAVQSRMFDTQDRSATLRAVIATLQDLGFVVERADDAMGSVTGLKLSGYAMHMTVTVRPVGKRVVVRANAQYQLNAVSDPAPYQQFFAALSKALFLQAEAVD
jgi:hypothetical protein